MFPATVKLPVAGSKISVEFNTPLPFSPPAIKTRPSGSLVAVWPRRSTAKLELVPCGTFGASDTAFGATFTFGLIAEACGSEKLTPTVLERLANSFCSEPADAVEDANAVVATAIKPSSTRDRAGLFLSLSVAMEIERTKERKGKRGGCLMTGELLRYAVSGDQPVSRRKFLVSPRGLS